MIDRLHDALPYLEHLSPEAQEEAATYIEALAEVLKHTSIIRNSAFNIFDYLILFVFYIIMQKLSIEECKSE